MPNRIKPCKSVENSPTEGLMTGDEMPPVNSRTRATLVRDYLAGKGVPAAAMTVRAYGETAPIIATEDGVREVQNRRVEIRSTP